MVLVVTTAVWFCLAKCDFAGRQWRPSTLMIASRVAGRPRRGFSVISSGEGFGHQGHYKALTEATLARLCLWPHKMPQTCVEHMGNSGRKILRKELKSRKTAKDDWKCRRKAAAAFWLVQNKHSTRSGYEASETMLIFVIMGGQWMDGLFDEPSARAVNSPPPSCYKDSIEQVAPAMPRARHEPNWIVISRCGSIAIFYQERRNAHAQYRDRCVQRKKYRVRNEAGRRNRVHSIWSSAHKGRNFWLFFWKVTSKVPLWNRLKIGI